MKKLKIRLLLTAICVSFCVQWVLAAELLVPGGQVIGLQLEDETVTVAAFEDEAAKSCGLQVGDRLVSINGQQVHSVESVREALKRTDGEAELSVLRNGKTKKIRILPKITGDGPRLGVYLKQGVTGVGTVTWYDPDSGNFGALGHGVNRADGGLIKMNAGAVYEATVISVKTGKSGTPGQLMSAITGGGLLGELSKNTVQGVFGSARFSGKEEPLPVGTREQVHTGEAVIRSTVKGNQVQEYSVEILKVYPNSGQTGRNMLLKVTDPELLAATGGIVQGMSGSPILQNGRIVGAVTHVLVNDPTMGYGIFIENMLDAAA